ncbi:hypothetical protein H2198_007323 [Neophaeococcomyces mojaviensis]|uniref:Uncharacterized protein n=1 Tax=Neophaeococcomyces mojaviensis TaxID=3383035 RepID=A0ACC3A0F9_9EURO|nr:hypothetical protein H2198_007323 [Knufia sp. JES_112]
MSATVTTTTLGTSNLRGSSRQTRINPARTSRNARPTLRQNSLLSNPASVQGAPVPEPHGFYPAITHFTDAITALPRDFRRHTSLLKEVDAKAWTLEENLQRLLTECLHERQTRPITSAAHTVAGSSSSIAGDAPIASAANSVNGMVLDTASQYSNVSVDPDLQRRRQLYAALRNNLMQMMMPLDEKNHVISNANEELSRHTRRQDEIWPHIADEISEETRLGSLRHWALTDLNPTKKAQAAATRGRDAAASLALPHDTDIAERSERRREAILAKKQKTAQQQVASDADDRAVPRKGAGAGKKKTTANNTDYVEIMDSADLHIVNPANIKYKGKPAYPKAAKAHLERQASQAASGGIAMSRENSQQENSKKRKAPAAPTTLARKRYVAGNVAFLICTANMPHRIHPTTQESPKLAHSPLAGTFGKDAHKRSPALTTARPVNGRGRQNSGQVADASNRPSSSASRRNGVTANAAELDRVALATGKTPAEIKHTMRETINSKGEKMLEEDVPDHVENRIRGGILLERSASKSSQLKKEANLSDETVGRRIASPRLSAAAMVESARGEKNSRGKALKTSTPVAGTFAEAESESTAEATSTAENGSESAPKLKRPARPRMKDHHGLHDSLSPKGLPTKRMHKKNGSYSLAAALNPPRNTKDREDETPVAERKGTGSRANSRSTKNTSTSDTAREGRNASSTPKIGGPATELVDEPDSLPSATSDDAKTHHAPSRRQSSKQIHNASSSSYFDVKPPTSNPRNTTTAISPPTSRPGTANADNTLKHHDSLGSPGPEEAEGEPETNADADAEEEEEEEEEEDPNEQRYCYCNGVSYGEMVACDNESCAREWFHLECTGLRSLPPARSMWYCDECKGMMVK